jgi:hypothetical protein
MGIFVRCRLPSKTTWGRPIHKDKALAVGKKINKVFQRGYILEGSTIDFFDVEKGDDIRVVYNGTSWGLNDALFAPGFYLPKAAPAINGGWAETLMDGLDQTRNIGNGCDTSIIPTRAKTI